MDLAGCTVGVRVAVFGSGGGIGVAAVVVCNPFSFASSACVGAAPGLGTEATGNCDEGPNGFSFFPSACATGDGAPGATRGTAGCATS